MFSGISVWQLLILLVIVILVFGTKRLGNLGKDLGSSLRDFRGAMKDHDSETNAHNEKHDETKDPRVVDHVRRESSDAPHSSAPHGSDSHESNAERRD